MYRYTNSKKVERLVIAMTATVMVIVRVIMIAFSSAMENMGGDLITLSVSV